MHKNFKTTGVTLMLG